MRTQRQYEPAPDVAVKKALITKTLRELERTSGELTTGELQVVVGLRALPVTLRELLRQFLAALVIDRARAQAARHARGEKGRAS